MILLVVFLASFYIYMGLIEVQPTLIDFTKSLIRFSCLILLEASINIKTSSDIRMLSILFFPPSFVERFLGLSVF